MAVQVRVEVEGESHRVVSDRWRDAVIQLGVFFGDVVAEEVPDFGSLASPAFEVQAFALRVWPDSTVWVSSSQIEPSMTSAIQSLKVFMGDSVLLGGTPRDQELMWARLVEETSTVVTCRDGAGRPAGQTGYMRRAELADEMLLDDRIIDVTASHGMSWRLPGEDLTGDYPDLSTDLGREEWTL